MTATALVVDDEVDLCRLMQITLTKMGIRSDVAYDLAQARTLWEANAYDFCLTDLQLPDGSGLELVKHISASSSAPVAVITAHGSMDLAIEALKLGAFDFVNKPLELPRLRQLIESALKVIRQDDSSSVANTKTPEQQLLNSRLIGDTDVMHTLKRTVLKLSRSQAPVFLSGASGTGKEVVARLIHDLSSHRDGSFVAVNCGAIPSELMESEFFGHKKGSFTGAVADKQGLFQQASGGTLFLDEIADLPLVMQVKLLRAIQEKSVRAIGDTKEVAVDIRLLSATHKDLAQLVQSSHFRQDLYYRINVIELKLPTLNERSNDIDLLAKHFLELITKEWQLDNLPKLNDEAIAALQKHQFSGNVRELRNVLERAVTLAETDIIEVEHLGLLAITTNQKVIEVDHSIESNQTIHRTPNNDANNADLDNINVDSTDVDSTDVDNIESNKNQSLLTSANNNSRTNSTENNATNNSANAADSATASKNVSNEQSVKSITTSHTSSATNLHPYRNHAPQFSTTTIDASTNKTHKPEADQGQSNSSRSANSSNTSISTKANSSIELPQKGLEAYLQDQEKQLIITALKQTGWNKTQAAELLGTTFRSLRYRMKKLEIDEDEDNE